MTHHAHEYFTVGDHSVQYYVGGETFSVYCQSCEMHVRESDGLDDRREMAVFGYFLESECRRNS